MRGGGDGGGELGMGTLLQSSRSESTQQGQGLGRADRQMDGWTDCILRTDRGGMERRGEERREELPPCIALYIFSPPIHG